MVNLCCNDFAYLTTRMKNKVHFKKIYLQQAKFHLLQANFTFFAREFTLNTNRSLFVEIISKDKFFALVGVKLVTEFFALVLRLGRQKIL